MYYVYTDNQGSILALTDDAGTEKRRYAYDPWGKRRDADNWNAADNGGNLIVNRGYTGHEHLDAFGIINMNGRVYDPYTATFFSPDPYVQSPGDWLNYNRYGYCTGNPFKFVDPSGELQIGPFYLSFNIGWSPNGGLSFGISAGVGIENVASVGVSIGFGAKYGNFSFSVNGSLGGAYAYAGFDTKSGFMAGVGYSVASLSSGLSPVNISTNMLSAGVDYSESGGFSANAGGLNYGAGGFSFNSSIGVSYTTEYEIAQKVYGDGNSTTLTTNKNGSNNSTNSNSDPNYKRIHRLYKSSKLAYKYMMKRSERTGHEIAAVYIEDGRVLVFDDRFNTGTSSENRFAGENSSDVNINGTAYSTTGEVHTHPGNLDFSSNNPYNPLKISDADWRIAGKYNSTINIIMEGRLFSNIYLPDYWNNKFYNLQSWEIK